MFDFKFEGLAELTQDITKIVKSIGPDKSEPVLNKGARKMALAIRSAAPKGPTGNLKKAVKAKMLQRWGRNPAPSIAAVDRKKAPAAHLVEYGSKGVRIGKKGSRKYRGKSFGVMPANPFFRRTVDEKGPEIIGGVVAELTKLLDGAIK